jgi:hypothetical protein
MNRKFLNKFYSYLFPPKNYSKNLLLSKLLSLGSYLFFFFITHIRIFIFKFAPANFKFSITNATEFLFIKYYNNKKN